MSNIAKIEQIRSGLRALRNSVELKGDDKHKYNVMLGVSFAPAKGMNGDQLIEAIEKNKKVSTKLIYGMQAGLVKQPGLDMTKEELLAYVDAFEKELSELPQDIGANATIEFTVSNPHEKEILDDAQKAVNAIIKAEGEDVQKLRAVPGSKA